MRRIHLKKTRKIKKINIIIIILIILIFSIIKIFHFASQNITPVLMKYAELQASKMAILVINQAINQEVLTNLSNKDLFLTTTDNNNKTSSIDFNPVAINKLLSSISTNVRSYLEKLESGEIKDIGLQDNELFDVKNNLKNGVVFYVSTGIVFDNSLLANLGPKIPVKLNFVGNIYSDVITDIQNYGINNALIQVIVKIKVTEQVILPYNSKTIEVESKIPLAMKLIQGDIPNYYFNGNPISTNISSLNN